MRVILASASPRRRELLGLLGVDFAIIEPIGVDEESCRGPASWLAPELARQKAESVARHLVATGADPAGDTCVLGADTVVVLGEGGGEQVLGKPRDEADARRMLRLLAGKTHSVWTGVAVARGGQPTRLEAERTEVTFKPLTDAEVDAHVATGDWAGKAGAYGIQSAGGGLVQCISGCYYNVVGLPLVLTGQLLAAVGVADYRCDCLQCPLQAEITASSPRPCAVR